MNQKQEHYDPSRPYNGPLQKREKVEEETKSGMTRRGNNEIWHGNEYKNCMMTIAVDVLVD